MSFSQTTAIGRLVADPEMRNYGNAGKQLANFRIAVNTGRDESQFYNCVAFDRTAEIIRDYAQKGKQIHIVGVMKNENYESKKYTDEQGNPAKMYGMSLIVNQVTLLGDAPGGGGQQAGGQRQGGYQQNQQAAPNPFGNQQQQQQQAAPTPQSAPMQGFSGFGNISEDDLPF